MKTNYSLFKKFFIILFIFIQYEIYSNQTIEYGNSYDYDNESDSVYVFCSTKCANWKWLKENRKIVKVDGMWVLLTKHEIHYSPEQQKKWKDTGKLFTQFYILNGGEQKLNELKKKCISQFGDEYEYPQPAGTLIFDDWHLFGLHSGVVFPGIATEIFSVDRWVPLEWGPYYRHPDLVRLYPDFLVWRDWKRSYGNINLFNYYASIEKILLEEKGNFVHLFSNN